MMRLCSYSSTRTGSTRVSLENLDSAWFFSLLVIVKWYTVLSYSKVQCFLPPNESIAALIVRNRVRNLVMTCERSTNRLRG
jgi:hypothetical protein